MIRAVTIDCWDTILESNPAWEAFWLDQIQRAFSRHDPVWQETASIAAFREEARQFVQTIEDCGITLPLRERLRNLCKVAGLDLPDDALQRLGDSLESAIFQPLPRLLPGAGEFLENVKAADKRLGLICNTGWFSSRTVMQALAHYGIDRLLDFAIFSDVAGCAKPSPEIFSKARQALGSAAAETAHIGDNLVTDVRGALDAGQYAIHVHRGGRCTGNEIWCASDYKEVWHLLTSRLLMHRGEPL